MYYFAYGSNMSLPRLQQRVPSATALGVAVLQGHRLVFHKAGRDGSAKCDAAVSPRRSDSVHGVLCHMASRHKPRLDEAEGLGRGYEHKTINLQLTDGSIRVALTYYATDIDANLRPYSWYLEHVMRGAHAHRLPDFYTMAIAGVDTVQDPDQERHRMELAIYNQPLCPIYEAE
jgi:hypothetical protein